MAALNPQAPEYVSVNSSLPVLPCVTSQASEFVYANVAQPFYPYWASPTLPINPLSYLPYRPEAPEFSPDSVRPNNPFPVVPYHLDNPSRPTYFYAPSDPYFCDFPFMENRLLPNYQNYDNYLLHMSLSWQFNPMPVSSPTPEPAIPAFSYLTQAEQAEVEKKRNGGTVKTRVGGKGFRSSWCSKRGSRKEEIQVLTWKRKSSEDNPSCREVNSEPEHEPEPDPDELQPVEREGTRTTLMIRNIPNKFSRQMLIDKLDEHCKVENQKLEERSAEVAEESLSAFDFVYLPMDFGSRCNKGYAFVNFTIPRAAWKLHLSWNNQKWDVFGSKKISEITYARIQGKDALVRHFQNSTFACDSEDFLPIYFIPRRDGSGSSVLPCTVGRRVPPFSRTFNKYNHRHLSL